MSGNIPRVCLCAQARSGSSMLMRMLEFGGLKVDYSSGKNGTLLKVLRNPYGLYESMKIVNRRDRESNSIKLLKASLLSLLPDDYKVIFLNRSIIEISRSWEEATVRGKRYGMPVGKQQIHMAERYNNWDNALANRSNVLRMEYNEVCSDPLSAAAKIAAHVSTDNFNFNIERASTAVDKSLYIDRRI